MSSLIALLFCLLLFGYRLISYFCFPSHPSFILGAASPQEQRQTPHITDDDPNEEAEEDELEEEEDPTPTAEKDNPIPPTTEEDHGEPNQDEAENEGVEEGEEEEEEEGLNGADEETQEEKEDKIEEEEKREEEEDKDAEGEEPETEEPKSNAEEGEAEGAEEAEEETKQPEEDEEEDEEAEDYDDDEEEEEDDDTTADLLTDTNFSPIKLHNSKSNLAKTNGHVLSGSEERKPNPVTPPPPSPTSEPLLCPLVESELSYTDRDNSLSSGYEMYNGELLEPGLTNGSSDRHRVTMPFFPDLPLDPEPENPVTVGIAGMGAGPSPNSPSADRSRTVSSSSTGDAPKGKEGTFPAIQHKVDGGRCLVDASSATCVRGSLSG